MGCECPRGRCTCHQRPAFGATPMPQIQVTRETQKQFALNEIDLQIEGFQAEWREIQHKITTLQQVRKLVADS